MNKIHNWINTLLIVALFIVVLVGGNTNQGFGGSTSDSWSVGGNLSVTGTSALTGALTLGGKITTDGGSLHSYTSSTSTTATTYTLTQADILNYDTILMTPNTGDLALTLPATSTLTSLVPTAGDMAEQCWHNASSTAGIDITFAAGTGITLLSATSTSGGIGAPTIQPLDIGCFKFVRQGNTDVTAAFTTYKDAD